MKFLGMQIMVEGLALAAFGMIRDEHAGAAAHASSPRYVMGDEARHVAFGVLSLRDYYTRPARDGEAPSARTSSTRRRG